jgi:hypothetical protein
MSPGGAVVNSQGRKPLGMATINAIKPRRGDSDSNQPLSLSPLRGFAIGTALFPGAYAPGY